MEIRLVHPIVWVCNEGRFRLDNNGEIEYVMDGRWILCENKELKQKALLHLLNKLR